MDRKELTPEQKEEILREEMAWLAQERAREIRIRPERERIRPNATWLLMFHLTVFVLGLGLLLLFRQHIVGLLSLTR